MHLGSTPDIDCRYPNHGTVCLAVRTGVAFTSFRAIFYFVPTALPFFAPKKRALAIGTYFFW
jgi:hypothetical protein